MSKSQVDAQLSAAGLPPLPDPVLDPVAVAGSTGWVVDLIEGLYS